MKIRVKQLWNNNDMRKPKYS